MKKTQYPNIPEVPFSIKDEATRLFLQSIKENIELLTGKRGDKNKYQALTKETK